MSEHKSVDSPAEALRHLTVQDFALLGLQELAYVRPVVVEGQPAYGIFAANGTQIALAPARDVAFAAVRQHELEACSVH